MKVVIPVLGAEWHFPGLKAKHNRVTSEENEE
jgi:hypothetical protein